MWWSAFPFYYDLPGEGFEAVFRSLCTLLVVARHFPAYDKLTADFALTVHQPGCAGFLTLDMGPAEGLAGHAVVIASDLLQSPR